MTAAHLGLAERERGFGQRAGTLVGVALRDRPAQVGIGHASVEDALGENSLLRVELLLRLTPEEALRLRYGDDAVVTRTERGWTVEFPESPDGRQASDPE